MYSYKANKKEKILNKHVQMAIKHCSQSDETTIRSQHYKCNEYKVMIASSPLETINIKSI
jgi:hypothetical protein